MSDHGAHRSPIIHAAQRLNDCPQQPAVEPCSCCNSDLMSITPANETFSGSDVSTPELPSSVTSHSAVTSEPDCNQVCDSVDTNGLEFNSGHAAHDDVIADLARLEISDLDSFRLPQIIELGCFGLDGQNDDASSASNAKKGSVKQTKKQKDAQKAAQRSFMSNFFTKPDQSSNAVASSSTAVPTTTDESQAAINAADDRPSDLGGETAHQSTEKELVQEELDEFRRPGDTVQRARRFRDVIPDSQEEPEYLSEVVTEQPSITGRRFEDVEEIANSQESQFSFVRDDDHVESESMAGIEYTTGVVSAPVAVEQNLEDIRDQSLLRVDASVPSTDDPATDLRDELKASPQKSVFDAMMKTRSSIGAQSSASGSSKLAKGRTARVTGVVAPKSSKLKSNKKMSATDTNGKEYVAGIDLHLASELTGPSCHMPTTQDELLHKNMTNIVRFHDADLTISQTLDVEASWSTCFHIDDVLRMPRQPERDWVCLPPKIGSWREKISPKWRRRKAWVFTFINRAISIPSAHEIALMNKDERQQVASKQLLKKFEVKSVNNIRPKALSDVAAAQRLGDLAADYMNRWPAPTLPVDDETARKFAFWPFFFFKIFHDLFPDHKPSREDGEDRVLPFPRNNLESQNDTSSGDEPGRWYGLCTSLTKHKDKWYARTRPFNFHADGTPLEAVRAFWSPGITDALQDIPIPTDVPDMWYDMWVVDDLPEDLPEEDHELVRKAQKLMHALMYRVAGAIGTNEPLLANFGEHRDALIDRNDERNSSHSHRRGPWAGNRILTPSFKDYAWSLERSRMRTHAGWPSIRVKSASKTDAAFVMEATTQHYMQTPGLAKAVVFGALIADLLNNERIEKAVIRKSVICCRTDKHRDTPHICQWCLECADCLAMVHVDSITGTYRVCHKCAIENGVPPDEIAQVHLFNIKALVYSNLRYDRKRAKGTDYPITPAVVKSTADRIIEQVSKNISSDGLKIMDDYCPGIERSMVVDVKYTADGMRKYHPFQPSLDAIDALHLSEGKLRLHVPDNVVITSYYINMMKNIWPVALLQVISDHQRLRSQSEMPDQASLEQIYLRLDHIYIITLQLPHSMKDRLTRKYQKLLPAIERQLRSGLADPNARPRFMWKSDSRSHDNTVGSRRETSTHPLLKYVPQTNEVLSEMEQEYGRKIPRSKDGAPWLWMTSHMPNVWTWTDVLHMFGIRLDRMDDHCDDKNEHFEESSITLLIECAEQWFRNHGKDEFLGLEQTIFKRHPCRWALGHRDHNKRMRTGCKVRFPSSYARDYDASLSNVLFETAMANFCKMNFDEDQYGAILADIVNIWLSDRLLQRSGEPVTQIEQLKLLNSIASIFHDSFREDEDDDELSENEVLEGEFVASD